MKGFVAYFTLLYLCGSYGFADSVIKASAIDLNLNSGGSVAFIAGAGDVFGDLTIISENNAEIRIPVKAHLKILGLSAGIYSMQKGEYEVLWTEDIVKLHLYKWNGKTISDVLKPFTGVQGPGAGILVLGISTISVSKNSSGVYLVEYPNVDNVELITIIPGSGSYQLGATLAARLKMDITIDPYQLRNTNSNIQELMNTKLIKL